MELLDQIETYLAQQRMPPSKFGRLVVGDPRFVDDLRGGRLPRVTTRQRVLDFLAAPQAKAQASIAVNRLAAHNPRRAKISPEGEEWHNKSQS